MNWIQNFFESDVLRWERVHGGDISESYYVETGDGRYFLKLNDAKKHPGLFAKEAGGLRALAAANALHVPAVIDEGVKERQQYLVLEWLEAGPGSSEQWIEFGRGLAMMHRKGEGSFGWEGDNFIGSLPQPNPAFDRWKDFYAQARILPLVRILVDHGIFSDKDSRSAGHLAQRLGGIFPDEPPALLHGDLWSGNYMFSSRGPAIFDPAVYRGHREMDLGMSLLFGGFDRHFYDSYHEAYPLERSWKERVTLTQLYPLLVHAILFGGHYVARCREIVAHWK